MAMFVKLNFILHFLVQVFAILFGINFRLSKHGVIHYSGFNGCPYQPSIRTSEFQKNIVPLISLHNFILVRSNFIVHIGEISVNGVGFLRGS